MLEDGATVQIRVTDESGNTEKKTSEFHVSKALLLNATPYFQALKNFKEGEEDVIEFKDIDPNAVGAFLYWLYTGRLPQEPKYRNLHALISSYTFGDRILAPEFKDLVIDQLAYPESWDTSGHYTPRVLTTLQEVGLRSTDTIGQYLIDHVVYNMVMDSYNSQDDNQEFFHAGGEWA